MTFHEKWKAAMKTKTFVSVWDKVNIYQSATGRLEGVATVVRVHRQSDEEAAFVDVRFDDDGKNGPIYPRWVWPKDVI